MTADLLLLVLSTTLVGGYIGVQGVLYRIDVGVEYAASGRDDDRQPGVFARRAERALRNLLETYGVFIALAAVAAFGGRGDALTQWGGWIYFLARWAYLPLYLFGVQWLRSLAWTVSAVGLSLMFFGVLF